MYAASDVYRKKVWETRDLIVSAHGNVVEIGIMAPRADPNPLHSFGDRNPLVGQQQAVVTRNGLRVPCFFFAIQSLLSCVVLCHIPRSSPPVCPVRP